MTCFRAGAAGTNDEAVKPGPDVDAGFDFLEKLQPQILMGGNHEARLHRLAKHPNAIVSTLSQCIIGELNNLMEKLDCEYVPWAYKTWREVGNYKLMHGYIYNENACRDHAEAFGNVIHAHTHRAGMAKGRRCDNPSGYSVGTLASIPNMDYAMSRRSTLSWSSGFVWGEYCDDKAVVWLHEQAQENPVWRLPVS